MLMIEPWHTFRLKVLLPLRQKLWWRFMPGISFKVSWPSGTVMRTHDHPLWDWTIGPVSYKVESSDPNEHYRPTMEKLIGKQGWDWDWCLTEDDVMVNKITIKVRHKHKKYATMLALKWS